MRPVAQLTAQEAQGLAGVLFDLDDTVLDHGALSQAAYAGIHQLKNAGLTLVGVTGRPASWGQVLARQWPLDGMVTENGIIALREQGNRISVQDRLNARQRRARTQRLHTLVSQIRERWPELQPSDDTVGRIADFSLDIKEARTVSAKTIQAARHFAARQGARSVVSSIQLHLSYDIDDKASGSLRYLQQNHGFDPTEARYRFAFIGDSGNDAPCFACYHTSIGVKNLTGRHSLPPRFIAKGERGAGFVESAELLLKLRR